jgi:ribulose kinase
VSPAVLGLDVGTESVRAGLFGLDGSVVTADADGVPTGPALLLMDTRPSAEAAEITATSHPSLWYTGGHVSPEWMLRKALWLSRHQTARYRSARWLVELHDWIVFRLTGQWTLASATTSAEWGYDPHAQAWSTDLLSQIGLSDLTRRWPETMLAPGEAAGQVTAAAAAATGLPAGLPVAQGLMDSISAALACEVFRPGRAVVSLGSSSSYMALVDEPVSDPRLLGPIRDALGPGTYLMQGGQTSAASLVRWFTAELGGGLDAAALDAKAGKIPPGSDGIIALDTWQGSRTPFRDLRRRGAFTGLSLAHSRAHLYRATGAGASPSYAPRPPRCRRWYPPRSRTRCSCRLTTPHSSPTRQPPGPSLLRAPHTARNYSPTRSSRSSSLGERSQPKQDRH